MRSTPHRETEQDEETRAEIARRRLAQLAAAFEAHAVPPDTTGPDTQDSATDTAGDGPIPRSAVVSQRRRVSAAHLRVVGVIGVAGLIVLGWMLLAGRPETGDPLEPVALAATPPSTTAEAELVIDVVGEVKQPGIVTVPHGSRVFEAIDAAGGLDGTVDTSGVNLARVLEDGEQIIVGPASAPAGDAGMPGAKISLNSSTVEQLDTLPGVGPVTAQAIVSWRDEHGRFAAIEDLLDVRGIGDATFDELRDLVVL